eukprot:TRINITY_DN6754_c0_g1_i3.p1 TRINITY_DN6754_c0_g1~~TRINITY_DN6754_c0_g1_i3.p1  ORF type:complete len:270 (-),score=97.07 TRINITY_DN6754_c0_g1_i3:87-896(-)
MKKVLAIALLALGAGNVRANANEEAASESLANWEADSSIAETYDQAMNLVGAEEQDEETMFVEQEAEGIYHKGAVLRGAANPITSGGNYGGLYGGQVGGYPFGVNPYQPFPTNQNNPAPAPQNGPFGGYAGDPVVRPTRPPYRPGMMWPKPRYVPPPVASPPTDAPPTDAPADAPPADTAAPADAAASPADTAPPADVAPPADASPADVAPPAEAAPADADAPVADAAPPADNAPVDVPPAAPVQTPSPAPHYNSRFFPVPGVFRGRRR